MTVNGNCGHTRNLRQLLIASGVGIDIYSSALYTTKSDRLKRGDILLKPGSHVAVVVQTDTEELKPLDIVAKEVIDGKWGNGAARRANLMAAGYNYAMVQAEVNKILKGSD